MTQTEAPIQAPVRPSLGAVLSGVALPFLLFAIVLATLLILSVRFLLPAFSRVEVGGAARTAEEVGAYQASLQASLIDLQQQRDQAILPISDPAYESLKDGRVSLPSFEALREQMLQTAIALVPEKDAVNISKMVFNTAERSMELEGDVRNEGLKSMTVLASFVDEIGRLPVVASVEPPVFQRIDTDPGGPHSPFTFTVHLR